MRLLLLFILSLCAHADILTVCASGCDYDNSELQDALNDAARGDIIELEAGVTYEGRFVLPPKIGSGVIVVWTSRWRELPAPGNRVIAAHAALMPKIVPPSGTDAALTTNEVEVNVLSADPANDVITIDGTHGWADGTPVAFWAYNNESATNIPMVRNQRYFVRDASGATLKIANTPGGAAVDLVTTATFTAFRAAKIAPVSGWKFVGIEFAPKAATVTQYFLVEIGTGVQAHRDGLPGDITMDRVYIHGIEGQNGPRACLILNTKAFTLIDSRIEHCNKEGEEGKAIVGWQAQGPLLIRNNYIAAGSINMLLGGDTSRIENLISGDSGGVRVIGNHFTRPFSTKYMQGTGGSADPSGACTDGLNYLNTTSGVLFTCVSSAWSAAPTPSAGEYYRRTDVTQNCASNAACWQATAGGVFATSDVYRAANYYTKNLFEMKGVKGLVFSGNVLENNWNNAEQAGYAAWICSQVFYGDGSAWSGCQDIVWENNIIRHSTAGLRIASNAHAALVLRNSRITVRNNYINNDNVATNPSIQYNTAYPVSFSGYCDDCTFDHNTIVSNQTGGPGVEYDGRTMTRWRFANNVGYMNGYGIFGDGGSLDPYFTGANAQVNSVMLGLEPGDAAYGGAYSTNVLALGISAVVFADSTKTRLSDTSPYSARCASGCAFAGTTTESVGANFDELEAATCGAVSGVPCLGRSIQIDPGSTRVVVRYTAPDDSSCNLTLRADTGGAADHGDTNTGPEKADTRTGNITNGTSRQFVLGTNTVLTASTAYRAIINCSGAIGYARFRTAATGAGYNAVISYSSARTGEYSSSADMSSPTAISSSATHTVPVPSASVRYYRAAGGAIRAFVSP